MSISSPNQPSVLVAEDEPIILAGVVLELEAAGFAVISAHDAQDALRKFEDHPEVTALFADIRMPGPLDGLSLANIVSRLRPSVQLILTSGGKKPVPRKMPLGASFLPKPYNSMSLAELICPAAFS
jgi:CheY-like chemotaxis protein